MAHPYDHARSSARRFGGVPEDYLFIHNWFDETKKLYANWRHRALRHHAEGIFLAERIFGVTITNADGRKVPVRPIGEQHVREDLGWIPTVQDWLSNLGHKPWMTKGVQNIAGEAPPPPTGDMEEMPQQNGLLVPETEGAVKESPILSEEWADLDMAAMESIRAVAAISQKYPCTAPRRNTTDSS
jgi:hypothetical protein